MKRAETGVMQFGDDWPGYFIRGDAALHLVHVIENLDQPIMRKYLTSFAESLRSCHMSQVNSGRVKPTMAKLEVQP